MRHLIYHIYPLDTSAGRRCWQWHLRQVNRYADRFDGQRLFAVVGGPGLAPAADVVPLLPPRSTLLALPNHTELGETYTLPLLLGRTYTVDPADTVFFAHAKGVTRVDHPWEATTRWWSLAMYRYLLDGRAATDLLERAPAVGWLKHEGRPTTFPEWSRWHYAGTFWWCRAAALFGRDWWSVLPVRFGAEAYLSRFFPTEQAASAFTLPGHLALTPQGWGRIYFEDFWRQIGIPVGPDADSYDASPA